MLSSVVLPLGEIYDVIIRSITTEVVKLTVVLPLKSQMQPYTVYRQNIGIPSEIVLEG